MFIVPLKCVDNVIFHDHVANRTGVDRTVSSLCMKEFMWKLNLKAHMLHFHPAEIAHE